MFSSTFFVVLSDVTAVSGQTQKGSYFLPRSALSIEILSILLSHTKANNEFLDMLLAETSTSKAY